MSPEASTLASGKTPAQSPVSEPGALSPEFLKALRKGYSLEGMDRARHNAVSNNDLEELALNRELLRGDDGHFSHRVKSGKVTNQEKSGRCWMFATLNTLRPIIMRSHGMEDFEFSVSHLQFWDRMERTNLYFEWVIELRDCDYLDREWEMMNRWSLEDGGWWNYLVALVRKYGVVPRSVMPETHGSSNTAALNGVLARLAKSRAAAMLDRCRDGAGVEELRAMKEDALREVYRFLVINFGEPPAEFEWRYRLRKAGGKDHGEELHQAEERNLSPAERFTPRAFAEKFIGDQLDGLVCLYNDPKHEMNRHFVFDRARNIVEEECMNFVNVGMEAMKEIAISSLKGNEAMWFAVNMSFDQCGKHGLMEDKLFDYETLFGVDLSLSKAERARFQGAVSNHAMSLVGVDLDVKGQPRKWLAENSWGAEKGKDGFWTIHDRWFEEHVYTIIVHRNHVPAEILACFEQVPKVLPAWYPGAGGVACVRITPGGMC